MSILRKGKLSTDPMLASQSGFTESMKATEQRWKHVDETENKKKQI